MEQVKGNELVLGPNDLSQKAAVNSPEIRAKAREIQRLILELAEEERRLYQEIEAIRRGTSGTIANLAIAGVVFVGLLVFGKAPTK